VGENGILSDLWDDSDLTAEAVPGVRGVAGGTFDDPNWFALPVHVWTRSAQHWMVYPPGVTIQELDDTM
jgi:hypothetical protein